MLTFLHRSLHRNLVEHLNAEIVLETISDVSVALEWVRSTFLYIRVMKNPKHYGLACFSIQGRVQVGGPWSGQKSPF